MYGSIWSIDGSTLVLRTESEWRLARIVAIFVSGRRVRQSEPVRMLAAMRLERDVTTEVPVSEVTEERVEALVTAWRTERAVYWALEDRFCRTCEGGGRVRSRSICDQM